MFSATVATEYSAIYAFNLTIPRKSVQNVKEVEWQENNYVKLSETDGKINKHFFVFLKTIEPVYISRVYSRPELGTRDNYRDNLTNQLSCLITSKYSVEGPICLLLLHYCVVAVS